MPATGIISALFSDEFLDIPHRLAVMPPVLSTSPAAGRCNIIIDGLGMHIYDDKRGHLQRAQLGNIIRRQFAGPALPADTLAMAITFGRATVISNDLAIWIDYRGAAAGIATMMMGRSLSARLKSVAFAAVVLIDRNIISTDDFGSLKAPAAAIIYIFFLALSGHYTLFQRAQMTVASSLYILISIGKLITSLDVAVPRARQCLRYGFARRCRKIWDILRYARWHVMRAHTGRRSTRVKPLRNDLQCRWRIYIDELSRTAFRRCPAGRFTYFRLSRV